MNVTLLVIYIFTLTVSSSVHVYVSALSIPFNLATIYIVTCGSKKSKHQQQWEEFPSHENEKFYMLEYVPLLTFPKGNLSCVRS